MVGRVENTLGKEQLVRALFHSYYAERFGNGSIPFQ